jgi:hypothetical protein
MSCTVDPADWGEKNRVHLATGKTQEWVLARTTRDRPTQASVEKTARAVMVKWFHGIPTDVQFADAGDAVDDIRVVSVSETPPEPKAGDQRRESLNPVPLLAAGPTPPLYVRITYNYRGYVQSLPWPVWTASLSPLLSDKLCPLDADWMLVLARDLTALPVAPEEDSALDKLGKHGPGPLADLAQLTQLAGWALVAYLGVQALGFARTFLPRAPRSRRAA